MEVSLTAEALHQFIKPYQRKIDRIIQENNPRIFGTETKLKEACEYALTNGGKRFRPSIVLIIGELIGENDVSQAAYAVELFHTASLVADDMPCMDNEDHRRNKPSVHKIYGETTALLASYALIAAGYGGIAKNAEEIKKPHIGMMALDIASNVAGVFGAVGGQYLDIYPPNQSIETLKEIIYKKTVSLFELTFLFGWLFGGGELEKIEKVKKASIHFGYAFQTADDLGDIEQDRKNERLNMVLLMGKEKALEFFNQQIQQFREALKDLQIKDPTKMDLLASILIELAERNKNF